MLYSEVENKIRDWIVLVLSSIQVIFANENAPRPSLPYITILVAPFIKIGQANMIDETQGDRTVKYDEDFNVSIQYFGDDWRDVLQQLKDSLQLEQYKDYFTAEDIAIRDDTPISDISLQLDNTIEKRGLFELVCGFARHLTENVNYVSTVNISETYLNPGDS